MIFLNLFGLLVVSKIGSFTEAVNHPFVWKSRYAKLPVLSLLNCTPIKHLLGVEYSQLDSIREPDVSKLHIGLYTGSERTDYDLSRAADFLLVNPNFKKDQPVVIFIHGFTSNSNRTNVKVLANTLVQLGGLNVLTVEATSLIGDPLYLRASTNVRFIGEVLGRTMYAFVAGGVPSENIHLMGHSLGAHIAAFAGKTYTSITGRLLGRISAMDPAGPCFFKTGADLHLQASDAAFVDVIHSNAGGLGFPAPMGHVDFYPNNAEFHPGCYDPICDHLRSMLFYIESITYPSGFPGVQCNGWKRFKSGKCTQNGRVMMGFSTPTAARGIYFLKTNPRSPYGMGLSGVNYKI